MNNLIIFNLENSSIVNIVLQILGFLWLVPIPVIGFVLLLEIIFTCIKTIAQAILENKKSKLTPLLIAPSAVVKAPDSPKSQTMETHSATTGDTPAGQVVTTSSASATQLQTSSTPQVTTPTISAPSAGNAGPVTGGTAPLRGSTVNSAPNSNSGVPNNNSTPTKTETSNSSAIKSEISNSNSNSNSNGNDNLSQAKDQYQYLPPEGPDREKIIQLRNEHLEATAATRQRIQEAKEHTYQAKKEFIAELDQDVLKQTMENVGVDNVDDLVQTTDINKIVDALPAAASNVNAATATLATANAQATQSINAAVQAGNNLWGANTSTAAWAAMGLAAFSFLLYNWDKIPLLKNFANPLNFLSGAGASAASRTASAATGAITNAPSVVVNIGNPAFPAAATAAAGIIGAGAQGFSNAITSNPLVNAPLPQTPLQLTLEEIKALFKLYEAYFTFIGGLATAYFTRRWGGGRGNGKK